MWQPVLRHIEDAATADKAPVWTEALGLHHAALQQEMLGKVAGPEEILPIDEWVELVRLALRELGSNCSIVFDLSDHFPIGAILSTTNPSERISRFAVIIDQAISWTCNGYSAQSHDPE